MIRPLLLLPVLLFLSACQSGALTRPSGLLFDQLRGGEFTLHRNMIVPPGRVRIIFQEGTASLGASEFQPRCELELSRLLDTPQTIPAGSYRIGKVRGLQRYVNRPAAGTLLAAADDQLRIADDGSNFWYMYTYQMQLLSDQQPNAPLLICGGAYNYPFYARYPTLQEMRAALGDYATLAVN